MNTSSKKPSECAPARIKPLAKLPIFYDLDGRRAVVAGGTAAAAWKAELLAAAGADVEVYAATCEPEMKALAARGAAAGRVVVFDRDWRPEILRGASIALADCETDDDAAEFYRAASAAGVPVNVIDKPTYCQFQFGSIINRSPVVIGVSTDGAAPILGQTLRRRIETLLPPSLADWVARAKTLRTEVARRLTPGPQRRTFWERFSDLAFSGAVPPGGGDLFDRIARLAGRVSATDGRVTLVGSGPGDPELMTLKAVRAMQAADVILFDDLVSEGVLELARREAKRMLVGKRGGRESCRQDDINALMVRLARQGKHVVRLKSGDPMIFGRAGEEIATLRAAGIPVAVVPGVTSASAMAAEVGVSLTHRDLAHSVRFVTGHSRNGALPNDLDWNGLADPETTLIVYMGGRTAAALATRLIGEGLGRATPVVIRTSVSRPDASLQKMSLGELAQDAFAFSGAPTLIGIGQVFATAAAADDQASTPSVSDPIDQLRTGSA